MDKETAETLTGGPSPEWFESALHHIALAAEVAGVAVIVLGAAVAVADGLRQLASGSHRRPDYRRFRSTLARGILLGLEFLVAADIIGTVAVEPTLENLYVLGLIVLIRTFLSISLELEIEGRWPWQGRSRSG